MELGGDGSANEARSPGDRHGQRVRVVAGSLEDRLDGPCAVPKDALQPWSHHRAVDDVTERAEGQRVGDVVLDQRPALDIVERVDVLPATVGAPELHVREPMRWVVLGDARPPRGWEAQERP